MKVYLVGGAVRDQLLGYPIKERDWVVVGGSPDELIKQGYQQVGRDFPVFLHPKTREEYIQQQINEKVSLEQLVQNMTIVMKQYDSLRADMDALTLKVGQTTPKTTTTTARQTTSVPGLRRRRTT